MYSRNDDIQPKRPVISSLKGAMAEIEHWMRENHYHMVKDGDGLTWDLDLEVIQIPDVDDVHGLDWQMTIRLSATVDVETFIQTGTLQRQADARLISLVGDARIPLALTPSVYTAKSEEQMRQVVASVVPKLKSHLMKNSFYDVKKQTIAKWVDEAQLMR